MGLGIFFGFSESFIDQIYKEWIFEIKELNTTGIKEHAYRRYNQYQPVIN